MALPRILVLHNEYREPGGEDRVFRQEADLLRERGHEVCEYVDSNWQLDESRPLAAGLEAIWSRKTVSALGRILHEFRPDVAHFHNTFSRISPAAYYACQQAGVPVVQTLHNYRLGCLNACCSRDGAPCETCVPQLIPWQGIAHKCYRGSVSASLAMAGIGVAHKTIGTFARKVDAYISTSHFARGIHLRAGIPESRSFVKPNFTPSTGDAPVRNRVALFVGRVCKEKGIHLLLEAWRIANLQNVTLKVLGEGPALADLRAGQPQNVIFAGALEHEDVLREMGEAMFLVHPSLLYENCGMAILEAFGAGLPCLAARLGSFEELISDGESGRLFAAGNAEDLAAKLAWMASQPEALQRMGVEARRRHRDQFTADASYRKLLEIYAQVCRS